MRLQPLWDYFKKEVFTIESSEVFWNPYKGEDSELDLENGSLIRKNNLNKYLQQFPDYPKFMLIGEAPGPWGCRFSGLAFTSERQLVEGSLPFYGEQSSTFDPPVVERSGSVLWGILKPYHPNFFVWNSIPLHPTDPGKPLSIRTPKKSELKEYSHILKDMIEIIKPVAIVAIGRKAEMSLEYLGIECTYVRHPSYGGTTEFRTGIADFFST